MKNYPLWFLWTSSPFRVEFPSSWTFLFNLNFLPRKFCKLFHETFLLSYAKRTEISSQLYSHLNYSTPVLPSFRLIRNTHSIPFSKLIQLMEQFPYRICYLLFFPFEMNFSSHWQTSSCIKVCLSSQQLKTSLRWLFKSSCFNVTDFCCLWHCQKYKSRQLLLKRENFASWFRSAASSPEPWRSSWWK